MNSCSQTLATPESPGGLTRTQVAEPLPLEFVILKFGGGAQDFAFLASSQGMLLLGVAAMGTTLKTTRLGHGQ